MQNFCNFFISLLFEKHFLYILYLLWMTLARSVNFSGNYYIKWIGICRKFWKS